MQIYFFLDINSISSIVKSHKKVLENSYPGEDFVTEEEARDRRSTPAEMRQYF